LRDFLGLLTTQGRGITAALLGKRRASASKANGLRPTVVKKTVLEANATQSPVMETPPPAHVAPLLPEPVQAPVPTEAEAASTEPAASSMLSEAATAIDSARNSGDADEVLRIWSTISAAERSSVLFQKAGSALLHLRRLDEAEAILSEGQEKFPEDFAIAVDRAWVSYARRNWAEAASRWRFVREEFPDHAIGYLGLTATLRGSERFDDAELLVNEGLTRFPDDAGLLVEAASLAQTRGLWEDAVHRWENVRTRYPNNLGGYLGGAASLREFGQDEQAEAVLQAGMQHLPSVPYPALDYAWYANRRKDWPEAARRWAYVLEHFPAHGAVGAASAYREMGDHDRADAVLRQATEQHPSEQVFIEYARMAQHREDWPEAVLRWESVRSKYPGTSIGYVGSAQALFKAGRSDEADELLRQSTAAFPDDRSTHVEYAQAAYRRKDLPEAIRRWEQVRDRFPEARDHECVSHAAALREAGRFDDADALLRTADSDFTGHRGILAERAWVAHARGDWSQALTLWQSFRAQFPDDTEGYIGALLSLQRAHRLDEADGLLSGAVDRFPQDQRLCAEHARLAQVRRDWVAAVSRWERLRALCPTLPEPYIGGANALIELQRYGPAEAALKDAMERFPENVEVFSLYAKVSARQHHWDDAIGRYEMVRATFPDDRAGYEGGIGVLRSQFRIEEAGQLLDEGIARHPSDPWFRLERATLAVAALDEGQRDRDQAAWNIAGLVHDFPDFEPAYIEGSRLLHRSGRPDDAEALVASGIERLPQSASLAVEYATAAEARADWPGAIRRYTQVTEKFGNSPAGYVGLARALSSMDRHAEADAILTGAMADFPSILSPFSEYAMVASRRQDWEEALRRWRDAQARFPSESHLNEKIFEARMRLLETGSTTDASDAPPGDGNQAHAEAERATSVASSDELVNRDLVMQFESLGGAGHGCEFGVFQRHFGAEPLGLLRWAEVQPDALVALLESEFAGVGLPENTEVVTPPTTGRSEYWTRDTRHFMAMRCFTYEDEITHERMTQQACRRLTFLSSKLKEDLRSANKIFVYKNMLRNLTEQEVDLLVAAMRKYGDNTLLYVRYEDESHANGTVEVVRPGLMVGYIDHFAFAPTNEPLAPPTASWLQLCRNAHDLWREAQTA
jgi:tetratricopeptide (TPR) repeat protein